MKDIIHTSAPEHAFVKTFCGMFADMERLEEDLHAATGQKPASVPAANIYETDTSYIIELALPGYQRNDIVLTKKEDMLTILATSHMARHKNLQRFFRQEFTACSFSRTFLLPDDAGTVNAGLSDGVLNIRIEKTNLGYPAAAIAQVVSIQ